MNEKPGVVITGASTGIGEACTHYLAKRGFQVFAGVRKPADAERLVRQATNNLEPLLLDVTESESVTNAAETVAEAVGNGGLASSPVYCGAGIIRPDCVTLGRPPRRTVQYVCGGLGRKPCQDGASGASRQPGMKNAG